MDIDSIFESIRGSESNKMFNDFEDKINQFKPIDTFKEECMKSIIGKIDKPIPVIFDDYDESVKERASLIISLFLDEAIRHCKSLEEDSKSNFEFMLAKAESAISTYYYATTISQLFGVDLTSEQLESGRKIMDTTLTLAIGLLLKIGG